MCNGTDCPLKENCWRYLATPSSYQSYFLNSPIKDDKCDEYWPYKRPGYAERTASPDKADSGL